MTSDKEKVIWKTLPEIACRLGLSEDEMVVILGKLPKDDYLNGISQREIPLSSATIERVSCLLGIVKSLRILFSDDNRASKWLNNPNSLEPFNGLSPKEYILNGNFENLFQTRKMLDSWTV